jgi:tetratricopeptide (TPR) repeat protein
LWPAATIPAAAFLYWTIRLTSGDHSLAVAARQLDQNDVRSAAASYTQSTIVHADLYFSRRLAQAAAAAPDALTRSFAAGAAYQAAVAATHYPEQRANAWYNLAAIAATRNDVEATEHYLRAAIGTSPNWFKPHWTLARLLEQTGRIDDAQKPAQQALDLNAGKHPEVAETISRILRSSAASR